MLQGQQKRILVSGVGSEGLTRKYAVLVLLLMNALVSLICTAYSPIGLLSSILNCQLVDGRYPVASRSHLTSVTFDIDLRYILIRDRGNIVRGYFFNFKRFFHFGHFIYWKGNFLGFC